MLRSLAGRIAFLSGPACLLGTILTGPALAQQPASGAEPPAVVGRIAEVVGTVSHKAAAANEWEKAERNWPIVVGDAVYVAADGRARLEIGGASVTIRPNAVIDLAALDDRSASLRANSGIAAIATAPSGETFNVITPRGNVALGPDGAYRITAGDEAGQTEIAVCRGGAVLADGQTRLREGEMAILSGDPAVPQVRVATGSLEICDAPPLQEARLPPKVSRRMTGIRDLGERGRWSRTPAGAEIWFPDGVGEDWAPYRNGRWSWVAPWGWTWVDDAPWGFAPFHYGRWSEVEGRWGWLPGEYAEHPVYAPAMVAFVDPPPDAVVGSEPTFGWVPLGPDEVYRPYYATPGLDYARRINMNVVGVGAATIGALIAAPLAVAALRNRRAATVVPAAIVNGGRAVGPAMLQTRPQVLASAPVRGAGQPFMPRPSGGLRMPTAPGRPVASPPRPLPPLAVRPNPVPRPVGPPGGPGGAMPVTPPVTAPGQAGPRPGRPAGRPQLAPYGRPGSAGSVGGPRAPGSGLPTNPGARRPPGAPPVARPTPMPRQAPVARPNPAPPRTAPVARQAPPPRTMPTAPRAAPPAAARPPAALAKPAAPPVARPQPMARPAAAPPRAAPAPRPSPPPAQKQLRP